MARLTKREIEQDIAANILVQFAFIKSMEEFLKSYNEIFNSFDLCIDPFTQLPCSPREYWKNRLEYEKQVAIEMYGHCDWLE